MATSDDARDDPPRAAGLLRFITCGSVDDGKSTLIGRLLFETGALADDQLAAVTADSQRWGTQGSEPDYALLLDGLAAEREQGITIDVAYRSFATDRRRFIVADTPGHEQYTRNMVTGASTAAAAVLLVDARKGLLTQTCRHACLVQLMGIRHGVLAVNKMDQVAWAEGTFRAIETAWQTFAASLGLDGITVIPLSALRGDNVTQASTNMPWYRGPTLLQCLEGLPADEADLQAGPLRLPVQWVNRPSADFRGYGGLLASGTLRPGDRVRIQPGGQESQVARIVGWAGDLPLAVAGQSVMVTLADDIDVARGDLISAAASAAEVADQFECTLVWMADAPLLPGRPYLLKIGTRTVGASVTALKYRLDVHTLAHIAARQLALNEIGVATLALDRPVAFDPYAKNRDTGGLILIDRVSNHTVAAGMLHFALRRSHNIQPQALTVDRRARAGLMGQRPCVLWFTGLSGAGKSTIANRVEAALHAEGRHTVLLDGDNLRHGLNKDLGFSAAERVENVRRVAEVVRLMTDAGLIVLVALISPFRAERALARSLLPAGEFMEIFVDAPLALAESRDPKGLYRRARRGELANFTGIDSPYEAPQDCELRLDTQALSADEAAEQVLAALAALQSTGS